MRGFDVSENAMGLTAVRIHYSCDPAKDPLTETGARWLEQIKRVFSDPAVFAQEMELNFWLATGTRVYPEFNESLHTRPLEPRLRKVIYRAWDFGWHAPACLFAQIDTQDRLCVLREIIGREMTTKQFAEMVTERSAAWFPLHTAGFQDFCDPAGQQRRSTAESSETRDVEILNKLGMYPSWSYGWSRNHGRSLVHQLLVVRTDGTPSLYVHGTQCPILLQGFLGKYVYAPTRDGRVHEEPDDGCHPWADIHACLRYLATGLYSTLGLRRGGTPSEPRPVTWHGYGSPVRSTT